MNVEQALHYCRDITRTHSSTFYLGSRIFTHKQRQAVTAVYAACRLGDDAVDEAPDADAAAERLARWWTHVELAYAGRPRPDEPLEIALAWALSQFDIPKDAFSELYLGLESDLDPQPYETLDDLMLYCRRVAGVVGLMIVPIAGYRGGERTLLDAVALGQAMQLTNILRDVGEDLELGRCYLPHDALRRHGVRIDDLRAGNVTPEYVALLEELAHVTNRLYRLAWQSIPKLHGVASTAVGVAALNYEGILTKLRANGYDNLTRRAHLKPLERIALIPRAVVGVVTHG